MSRRALLQLHGGGTRCCLTAPASSRRSHDLAAIFQENFRPEGSRTFTATSAETRQSRGQGVSYAESSPEQELKKAAVELKGALGPGLRIQLLGEISECWKARA